MYSQYKAHVLGVQRPCTAADVLSRAKKRLFFPSPLGSYDESCYLCRQLEKGQNIMAWQREHICEECGYVATTYEGKGLFGQHITAVACPDCRSIGNLVVGGVIGDVAPSFRSEVGRLCPNCGSDRISVWNGKMCPKCGGKMTLSEEKTFWT